MKSTPSDSEAIKTIATNVQDQLRDGQIYEMLEEAKAGAAQYPILELLAVHCYLLALDFHGAIHLDQTSSSPEHPIVTWAQKNQIQNMADIGQAIFEKVREHHAQVENVILATEDSDLSDDGSKPPLFYTYIMATAEQASVMLHELEEIRAHFPNWDPAVKITFSTREMQAVESPFDSVAGTLQ